jgi:hypothetical protein
MTLIVLVSIGLVSSCHRNEAGNREIHDAVWKGDATKVQALLKEHPELAFSKDGKVVLCRACGQ